MIASPTDDGLIDEASGDDLIAEAIENANTFDETERYMEIEEAEAERRWKLTEATVVFTGESNFFAYDRFDNDAIRITGYTGDAAELVIPTELDGWPVIAIGEYAFSQCNSLTSVTIPDNVILPIANPFTECKKLSEILVSKDHSEYPTLEAIEGVLFDKFRGTLIAYPYGSTEKSYVIPQGTQSIGNEAFYGCQSLKSITIPDSVTNISIGAFFDCDSLAYAVIPNDETVIQADAFIKCPNLTLIVSRDSLAEAYCKENDLPYLYIDEVSVDKLITEVLEKAG